MLAESHGPSPTRQAARGMAAQAELTSAGPEQRRDRKEAPEMLQFPFYRGKGLLREKQRGMLFCNEMLPVTLWASSRRTTCVTSVPEVDDVQT